MGAQRPFRPHPRKSQESAPSGIRTRISAFDGEELLRPPDTIGADHPDSSIPRTFIWRLYAAHE